ncbi:MULTISPECIES: FAD-dependent oxidoreductase [Thermomonosporaceae]|uniref:FAD-dependent oxidoreductase n=1 Tax=Thermomonosporaceae TaxID=2012 RepID=UPI00255B1931|nr:MULTISPECIES: FAD-dependent oxidoreductase [Thermomonosporaceae]MDL4773059.1 FAD-dependent monooxygenase [Actinomadura xylanilytica]
MGRAEDCEVLVVGGGLTGLSCAVFLAWHGVRCTLVERHPDLLSHPRQRSLGPRTLELYRQVGLEPRIQAARVDFAAPDEYVAVRAETLAGGHLPVDAQGDGERAAEASPCTGTAIDQDSVEALLRTRAGELGARIRFGMELRDLAERDGAVHARLRGLDGAEHRLRARYVVAADGADSPVRHRLGVPMEGPGDFYHLLTLMVDADLRPALAGRTVHMAFLERPRPKTFLMALDRAGLRWVFGTSDDPRSGMPGPGRCVELVRAAAGLPAVPVRLRPQIAGTEQTALRFRVAAAVAASYRAGRVFLIGDAAHLMPPTGGFGGATGVEDARNLAWKLAAVLRGHAGDLLLDTYQDERRPVGEFTMRQAVARSQFRFGPGSGSGPGSEGGGDAIVDRVTVMMGYRYRSAAVTGGGRSPAGPVQPGDLCGEPGTRAPHLSLGEGPGSSTIDLYGSRFVLLTGPSGRGWTAAARDLPVPVTVKRFGTGPAPADAAVRHGIGPDGALLVRPDGFVAWRHPGPASAPAAELRAALHAVLPGPPPSAR